MSASSPTIALIGLGEVGRIFAKALHGRGVALRIASRPSARAERAAADLGLALAADAAAAAARADLVLITTTGESLLAVARQIAPAVARGTIVADLTSAAPRDVAAAAGVMPAGAENYVDVAIMGAVSLHGIGTPLLASGPAAARFAAMATPLGFHVDARAGSAVGDASKLKLLRSVFAKGLDAVVNEAMLAAEAMGLRAELVGQLADFDRAPLREHIAMYLRTHPPHAARRLTEMQQAEDEILALGLPSLTTRAAIERYRRTAELARARPPAAEPLDAEQALAWLLAAERAAAIKS
ncbi:DUF1932 domain-containing protein [Chelatococcus reniformis]|uniref:NAD(P)-dependent oxidoreductase n=1 Tax=Chelatococcus reniformis TaxID=1494448 RepID=A0A916XNX8_9HYPH|nr:DUF1932 domain-containing protein [Chelatococcus reniformis]GGC91141.1 hypothetical protein GCM10010994_56140 [Chelatococcus reniformis]